MHKKKLLSTGTIFYLFIIFYPLSLHALPITVKSDLAKSLYNHPYLSNVALFTALSLHPKIGKTFNKVLERPMNLSLAIMMSGLLLKTTTHKILVRNKMEHDHDGCFLHYTFLHKESCLPVKYD